MQSPTREREDKEGPEGKEGRDKAAARAHRKGASKGNADVLEAKPARSLSPPTIHHKEREREKEKEANKEPEPRIPKEKELLQRPVEQAPPVPKLDQPKEKERDKENVVRPPINRGDFPSIIVINVGGQVFSTTLETLTVRDPDSMLARMFSGNYTCRKDTEGRYFIDRDGTHFRYILNYLRDGTFNFPSSIRDELLAEARFYQLRELIGYLEGKGNHYAAHQLSAKAIEVLRNRKGHDISVLKEYLLAEFERQAGSGTLTPVVAIYSTENSKLYRDASDPDIRNIVISDLQALGFKVMCQTTLSSAYAVHVFETSLHASSLVVKHELTEKINNITELLKSVISTDGYGGKVVKTAARTTE